MLPDIVSDISDFCRIDFSKFVFLPLNGRFQPPILLQHRFEDALKRDEKNIKIKPIFHFVIQSYQTRHFTLALNCSKSRLFYFPHSRREFWKFKAEKRPFRASEYRKTHSFSPFSRETRHRIPHFSSYNPCGNGNRELRTLL